MLTEYLYPFLAALVGGAITLITIKATKRRIVAETSEREASAAEKIQQASIALLAPLVLQIEANGRKIDAQAAEIKQLRETIDSMEKTEAYLMAQIHDKDKRIIHLEAVLKRAGLNGSDVV